jgi:antitoxin (DNA-binding transcriptional repressor) of toxin-antitoxin stability system
MTMFAKQISVQKSEANWDEVLTLVHDGAEVLIMQGDATLAKIVSVEETAKPILKERILGAHPGAMTMSGDFDEPLPDEFWLGTDA